MKKINVQDLNNLVKKYNALTSLYKHIEKSKQFIFGLQVSGLTPDDDAVSESPITLTCNLFKKMKQQALIQTQLEIDETSQELTALGISSLNSILNTNALADISIVLGQINRLENEISTADDIAEITIKRTEAGGKEISECHTSTIDNENNSLVFEAVKKAFKLDLENQIEAKKEYLYKNYNINLK